MIRIIAVVIIATCCAACDGLTTPDNGQLVSRGFELYSWPPLGVRPLDDDIDGVVFQAMHWWNEQIGDEVFFAPTPTPDVTVEIGAISGTADGIANITHSSVGGLILNCEVTLASDAIALHDRATIVELAKHELGHCLGLDDDPKTLHLNSIMSVPLWPYGEVTPHDRGIVRSML